MDMVIIIENVKLRMKKKKGKGKLKACPLLPV